LEVSVTAVQVRHATHSATCRGSNGLAGSPAARDRAPGGVIDEVDAASAGFSRPHRRLPC